MVLVAAFLAACGAGGQSPASSAQPSASAKASESNKPAESAKPSASTAAPSKDPIKLGVIVTSTGPQGAIGEKDILGTQMAVDEINAAGGILGRQVQLIIRDDGGDPTKALTAAQELVEKQGVTIIAGTTLSSPGLAMAPYLTEQKVVQFGSTSSDSLNDPQKFPYAFSQSTPASLQAVAMVKYVADIMKAKKVGIISETAAYGQAAMTAYKQELEKKGLPAPVVETYPQGAADMSAQLNNLKKAGVEVILSAALTTDAVRIIKNFKSIGWSVPYLGSVDLGTPAVIDGAGLTADTPVYAIGYPKWAKSDKNPVSQKTKDFAARLAKKMNDTTLKESPNITGQFYDIVYVLKAAIEKAQSTDGPKVAAAMEQLQDFDAVLTTTSFSKTNHNGPGLDDMVMVVAGSLKDGLFNLAPGY